MLHSIFVRNPTTNNLIGNSVIIEKPSTTEPQAPQPFNHPLRHKNPVFIPIIPSPPAESEPTRPSTAVSSAAPESADGSGGFTFVEIESYESLKAKADLRERALAKLAARVREREERLNSAEEQL